MDQATITIFTREASGTYHAKCNGLKATCTAGAEQAALAVAKKAELTHIALGIISDTQRQLQVKPLGAGMYYCNLGPMLPRRSQP